MEHLLIHTCDLYYQQKKEESKNYGLPSEEEFFFDSEPSKTDVKCYIYQSGLANRTNNTEPFETITEIINAIFALNEVIRHNDRLVFNGITYRIDNPMPVRNHHIETTLVRVNI